MVWAGKDLKNHSTPCCGQGHLSLDQVGPRIIQPGLDQGWGIQNFSGQLFSAGNFTLYVCGVFRDPFPLTFFPKRRQQRSYLVCNSRQITSTRSVEEVVSWGKGSLGGGFIFSGLKFFSTEQQAQSQPFVPTFHLMLEYLASKKAFERTPAFFYNLCTDFFAWIIFNGPHICSVAFRGPKNDAICLESWNH